jgi:hypothetical protein
MRLSGLTDSSRPAFSLAWMSYLLRGAICVLIGSTAIAWVLAQGNTWDELAGGFVAALALAGLIRAVMGLAGEVR